jgi:hypothetical protein
MGRKLVVFADGTGNSAASAFKTNVWRLYQALDLSTKDQLAAFDDGVGTSSFKPLRYLGLAVGVGVKRNVITLYKFLCQNYQNGDDIYGFGFSRGAFTIRLLSGLIESEGLVVFDNNIEQLDRNAVAAYRAYRREHFRIRHWFVFWVPLGRFLRDKFIARWNRFTGSPTYLEVCIETEKAGRKKIDIKFLGVWDTVAAYGLPIDELTRAVDEWVFPMSFASRVLSCRVRFARQALSLDDERRTFFPIPWDETTEPPIALAPGQRRSIPNDTKLLQVWFPGVHANVGGGYPDDGLAHVSLCWMIGEVAVLGLKFKPWIVAGYDAIATMSGRIYDSRAGFGALYRYQPRDAGKLMNPGTIRRPTLIEPIIDGSVVMRLAYGNDLYAPISLPETVQVLVPDQTLIPFAGFPPTPAFHQAMAQFIVPSIPDKLPLPAGQKRNLAAKKTELLNAVAMLTKAGGVHDRGPWVELVRDTVWWRRVFYFVSLDLALLVFLYPLLGNYLHIRVTDVLDPRLRGPFAILFSIINGFLPAFAAPWVTAFINHSTIASLIGLGIIASLWASRSLQIRIHDRARAAWNAEIRSNPVGIQVIRRARQSHAATCGFIVFLVLELLALAFQARHVLIYSFAIVTVIFFFLRIWEARRGNPSGDATPTGIWRLARLLRTWPLALCLYWVIAERVFPAVFLVASALVILLVSNRTIFDAESSAGMFCSRHSSANNLFWTSDPCWDSGFILQEGAHYYIQIAVDEPWVDQDVATDVEGFTTNFRHFLDIPLRRWWGENWFKPIARIGETGNDEYVLDAIYPPPATGILIAEITARSSGELYLYVNDSALAVPPWVGHFYLNHRGSAAVIVKRVSVSPLTEP